MRPGDRELAQKLETGLLSFHHEKQPLPGIADEVARQTLIEQLLESIRRVKYVSVISHRKISQECTDPNADIFDPIKAAIVYKREGQLDEAFWMVFLFVHFGKHAKAGWRYAREVYGRLGDGSKWNWANTSADPAGFRVWLHNHHAILKRKGVPGGFGNHRKYESLDAYSNNGTGAAIESYINWVAPPRPHQDIFNQEYKNAACDPKIAFDRLYNSLQVVTRFGRTARFDYLCMIGKLGLAHIEPGSAYIRSSTGPLKGAQSLFLTQGAETPSRFTLDNWLIKLDAELNVGMQVIEDALCNWQKNPRKFKKFRG